MKKICFISGTRADYGILAPVMREVAKSPEVQLQLVVTNMHLDSLFGMTVDEIEADGFRIDARIPSMQAGDSSREVAMAMAKIMEGLAEAFSDLDPDLVVVLGDRYEALAAASAAVVFNIPVAHLHGGEITLGAIDDKFRNAITQLASFHFASTPQYAGRIVAMGAEEACVFHSGAPGAEVRETHSSSEEMQNHQDFALKTGINPGEPFIILAFHPVTLLPDKGISELQATLEALDLFIRQGYKVLVTLPNSDPGNFLIRKEQEQWAERYPGSVIKVKSLGSRLFHHAMDNALAMVGNSSAALIEAPSHRLGAVNVGSRQMGRAHGLTVVDAQADKNKIAAALEAVMSFEMKAVLLGTTVNSLNPYFKENAAAFIAGKLIELTQN